MDAIDAFLDVDFTRDPLFVPGDLGPGNLDAVCGSAFEDTDEIFDDRRIEEEIAKIDAAGGGADLLQTRIYNQLNEGSCVANAFAQSHETVQAIKYGKDRVIPLSAMSLYKRIGSSPNSGAMVSDGINELVTKGILPLDTPANRARFGAHVMPNTGWRNPFPDGWKETAAKFKGGEYQVVRSVNGLFTALCRQFPVVVGRSSHSICYVRPMIRNGRWVVKYANSWGDWGDNGYGYDSSSYFSSAARWAVVVRTVYAPQS